MSEKNSAFNRYSNEARFCLRGMMIDLAEHIEDAELSPFGRFYAVLAGAGTAIAEVLKAAAETTGQADKEELFQTLLRQMADSWGQAHGERASEADTRQ